MGEEKALKVGPSGMEMAYERFGDPAAPPVLLIMGAGVQMISVGLLDVLGLAGARIVGDSLGGWSPRRSRSGTRTGSGP
jgi:hypothetical protein